MLTAGPTLIVLREFEMTYWLCGLKSESSGLPRLTRQRLGSFVRWVSCQSEGSALRQQSVPRDFPSCECIESDLGLLEKLVFALVPAEAGEQFRRHFSSRRKRHFAEQGVRRDLGLALKPHFLTAFCPDLQGVGTSGGSERPNTDCGKLWMLMFSRTLISRSTRGVSHDRSEHQ